MVDLLITRGKHRCYIIPHSELGRDWVRDTFAEKDILPDGSVAFNREYLEDWIASIETEDMTFEYKL